MKYKYAGSLSLSGTMYFFLMHFISRNTKEISCIEVNRHELLKAAIIINNISIKQLYLIYIYIYCSFIFIWENFYLGKLLCRFLSCV